MKITKKALLSNPLLLEVYLNSENIHHDFSGHVCDMFFEDLEKIIPFLASIIDEINDEGTIFDEKTNCWIIIPNQKQITNGREKISLTFRQSVNSKDKKRIANLIQDYQKQHNLPLLTFYTLL